MAPDNDEWYSTQGFLSIDSDNKFDNVDQVSPRHLSPKFFNSVFVTTIWMKQMVCNMIRMEKSVTI